MFFMNGGDTAPPMEYIIFKYRERFHLTPDQFREISLQDFLIDLQIIGIINDISRTESTQIPTEGI